MRWILAILALLLYFCGSAYAGDYRRPYNTLIDNGADGYTVYSYTGEYTVQDKSVMDIALKDVYCRKNFHRAVAMTVLAVIGGLAAVFVLPIYKNTEKEGVIQGLIGLVFCIFFALGLSNASDWYRFHMHGTYDEYIIKEVIGELSSCNLTQFSSYTNELEEPFGILNKFLKLPTDIPEAEKEWHYKIFKALCMSLAGLLVFAGVIALMSVGDKKNAQHR